MNATVQNRTMQGHRWQGEEIVPVEFVEIDTIHVHIKADANGGWYFYTSAGLYNGPYPHRDIACLEYFRILYAEKTGKIYMSAKASYDIDKVLAGDLEKEYGL